MRKYIDICENVSKIKTVAPHAIFKNCLGFPNSKTKEGKWNMNIQMLKAKIVEKGWTVDKLAAKIGMDRSTLYRKLNAIERFTVGEARRIKNALGLTSEEASIIFLL